MSLGGHFERVAAVYESLRTTDEAPVRAIGQLLPDRPVTGLPVAGMSRDQKELVQKVMGDLLAPFRKESSDPRPLWSAMLSKLRQVIEPTIGQLAQRFHCQRTWVRDLWHLTSRLARKLLSHTAAVLLNWRQGNPPLQLQLLISG